MKFKVLTLLCACVFGCASAPRYDAIALQQASDSQVCISAHRTSNHHPDYAIVRAAFLERVNTGKFSVEQCKQHFDNYVQQKAREDGAAFGRAIGGILGGAAEAYAANPRPSYAPPNYLPPVQQGMLRLLEGESISGTNRYCRYYGGVVVTVSNLTFCPPSIRQ